MCFLPILAQNENESSSVLKDDVRFKACDLNFIFFVHSFCYFWEQYYVLVRLLVMLDA